MSERIMSDEFDGLDAIEKTGIGAALIALISCRALAAKIANELRNKRPEHFVDKLSLAEIHASAPVTGRRWMSTGATGLDRTSGGLTPVAGLVSTGCS
jgi:hypothetical protein